MPHPTQDCVVCSAPLAGLILKDAWGHEAHAEHGGQPTLFCCSCQRILSRKSSNGGYHYDDGRGICGRCKATAVLDSVHAQQSKNRILAFLEGRGVQGIPPQTPVSLMDQGSMRVKTANHIANAKGLTVSRRSLKGRQTTGLTHAVYVLYGLPQIEFEGVLAHEFLHVWLEENAVRLPDYQTEGFCNLGSALWYEANPSEESKFHLKALAECGDPVYGKGYLRLLAEMRRHGWGRILEELKTRKALPTVSLWTKIFR